MNSGDCEHKNVEWVPYFSGTFDEPPHDAGYICEDCGEWIPPEDEATRKGL